MNGCNMKSRDDSGCGMSCAEVRVMLLDDCPEVLDARVMEHLEGCAECQQVREVNGVLAQLGEAERENDLSVDVQDAVRQRAREILPGRAERRVRVAWRERLVRTALPMAASIVAAIGIGFLVSRLYEGSGDYDVVAVSGGQVEPGTGDESGAVFGNALSDWDLEIADVRRGTELKMGRSVSVLDRRRRKLAKGLYLFSREVQQELSAAGVSGG